jgi:hypothetical protein
VKPATECEGFTPITGLADDLEAWFAGQQESQACPRPLMIIDDKQPGSRRRSWW